MTRKDAQGKPAEIIGKRRIARSPQPEPTLNKRGRGRGRTKPQPDSSPAATGTEETTVADADTGTEVNQPARKKRTYTRKTTTNNLKLDPTARVFFNKRLCAKEADTKRFVPQAQDQSMFDQAREAINPEDTVTVAGNTTAAAAAADGRRGEKQDTSTPSTPSGLAVGVGYQVKKIRLGSYVIDSWYISPYPDEYSRHPLLYICEFCLKYMKSEYTYQRHCMKCQLRHPPGDEIYRDGGISVFEVDGRKNKIYCQNLCLIGKMFLDTKTLYYDVEPFLFYILCEYDAGTGYHFAGYYSKEKRSAQGYNLSCIMILPSRQREGYGKLLIEFSYLLSKKEGVAGSPEKPLSDFGLLSYLSYWRRAIYEVLVDGRRWVSVEDISAETGLTVDDVVSTLQTDGMLQRVHGGSGYRVVVDGEKIDEYLRRARVKNPKRVDPKKLMWAPYLTTNTRMGFKAGLKTGLKAVGGGEVSEAAAEASEEPEIESAGEISV
ncbi:Histone acetyltransferase [Kickxella alabastrina]|nr:Histone acetyltransferase [Kickxella alabastrina]